MRGSGSCLYLELVSCFYVQRQQQEVVQEQEAQLPPVLLREALQEPAQPAAVEGAHKLKDPLCAALSGH